MKNVEAQAHRPIDDDSFLGVFAHLGIQRDDEHLSLRLWCPTSKPICDLPRAMNCAAHPQIASQEFNGAESPANCARKIAGPLTVLGMIFLLPGLSLLSQELYSIVRGAARPYCPSNDWIDRRKMRLAGGSHHSAHASARSLDLTPPLRIIRSRR